MPPHPNRFRPLLAAAVLAALALPAAEAGAAVLPADVTAIVSGTPDLLSPLFSPAADSSSGGQAVSRDGRFVVFDSRSDGLATDDDDDVENVYVKDMATGAVQLVSRADGEHGEPAHADCFESAISADGVAVAFVCSGPLDPRDGNGVEDVYVRNLSTQQTLLASVAAGGGAAGERASDDPAVAHDAGGGVFVAFQSRAHDLVAGLPAGDTTQRIYRRRIAPGGASDTALVAPAAATMAGNLADAEDPSISDDGAQVAFDTTAHLVPEKFDTNSDVFVATVDGGAAPAIASRASGVNGTLLGGGASTHGLISGDGGAVAFTSRNKYTASDADTLPDVYRRRLSGTFATELISVGAGGQKGNADSVAAAIDRDGGVVSFRSHATNLDPAGGMPGTDAYVNSGGGAQLVSQGDGNAGPAFGDATAVALSGDGSRAVVALDPSSLAGDPTGTGTVVLRDLAAATTRTVSRPPDGTPFPFGGFSRGGLLSADGRYAAFDSTAPGLGLPPGVVRAVFVRDQETGALTLASRADGADGAPFGPAAIVRAISGDGRRVSFRVEDEATAANLLYVRDLPSGRTFLASRADGPDGAPADAFGDSLSDDGARVVFLSATPGLVPGVNDGLRHAYVRDLGSNRTLLVDRADGEQGAVGDLAAQEVKISGDGRRVALVSNARNLVAGDANGRQDVFVRDLDAPFATRLASATAAGAASDADAAHVSIDRDGQRVAFETAATTLGATPPGNKLYVRDLASGTLDVAGRADGPDGAPLADVLGDDALLSGDGAHVAFTARPGASIAPGAPADGVVRLYERDLARGTTRLISRLSGPDGAANAAGADAVLGGVTADGGCVGFWVEGRFLPPPASSDFSEVFVRSVIPNCGRPVPPPPPDGSPGRSRSAAVLSQLAVRPARFRVGGRRGGTRIQFRLDRSVTVSLRVARLLPGRRAHGRCSVRARRGRRCTVVKRVGRLPLAHGRAGANAVRFAGRVGRRALVPGRYRLTATPAGGRSRTAGFVVVKAPRHVHHGRKGSR